MFASSLSSLQPSLRHDIGSEDYMPLRHKVLGPDRPLEALRVPGDEQARHIGILVSGRLVGCLSLFVLPDGVVQLRKFAILPEMQGQGLGGFSLQTVITQCQEEGTQRLILDARITAIRFYERYGFSGQGEAFLKGKISYIRMVKETGRPLPEGGG